MEEEEEEEEDFWLGDDPNDSDWHATPFLPKKKKATKRLNPEKSFEKPPIAADERMSEQTGVTSLSPSRVSSEVIIFLLENFRPKGFKSGHAIIGAPYFVWTKEIVLPVENWAGCPVGVRKPTCSFTVHRIEVALYWLT